MVPLPTDLPKVPLQKFLMDREKDRIGNLIVDTRRGTTGNAPIRDFRETQKEPARLLAGSYLPTVLTKVPMEKFLMLREKDRIGNLIVDTRRGTTGNAPIRDFRETQKEPARLLAGPSLPCFPFMIHGKTRFVKQEEPDSHLYSSGSRQRTVLPETDRRNGFPEERRKADCGSRLLHPG